MMGFEINYTLYLLFVVPTEIFKKNGKSSDSIPARPVDMNTIGK